jgi:hypothetical protein
VITVPRSVIVSLAALFSGYHIVLGLYSLNVPRSPWPALIAMVLFAVVTALSLRPSRSGRMPAVVAAFDLAVSGVVLLLVLSQLDPRQENGYATWVIAAVATLMTIVVVRQRPWFAWVGIGVLVFAVLVWSEQPLDLTTLGVVGGAVWVGVAHAVTISLARASRDAVRYSVAEQRTAEWQAQEEAEFFERRIRLAHMNRLAGPMLRRIVASGGRLDPSERLECLHLEAAMRDEIRGRRLLDDEVRREVMAARRRGVEVTLLDDGGIDDLDGTELSRITAVIAREIGATTADRVVVRTAPHDETVAVTIVGLRNPYPDAVADDGEDDLELWLEVPRR